MYFQTKAKKFVKFELLFQLELNYFSVPCSINCGCPAAKDYAIANAPVINKNKTML